MVKLERALLYLVKKVYFESDEMEDETETENRDSWVVELEREEDLEVKDEGEDMDDKEASRFYLKANYCWFSQHSVDFFVATLMMVSLNLN